jgi:ribonuclease E
VAEVVVEVAAPVVVAVSEAGEEGANRDGARRRGRRGGRRERERREQRETTGATEAEPSHLVQVVEGAAQEAAESVATAQTRAVVSHLVAEVEPVSVTAVNAVPELLSPVPQAVESVVVVASVEVLADGLVQIETDPAKRVESPSPVDVTAAAPRRRSRPREVYSIENSEPLVQIETQNPAS